MVVSLLAILYGLLNGSGPSSLLVVNLWMLAHKMPTY